MWRLSSARRRSSWGIRKLFQDFPGCEIKDHVIEWSNKGHEKQADRIVGTVRKLAFAATRLRDSAESGREEEAAEVVERRVTAPELEPIAPAVIAPTAGSKMVLDLTETEGAFGRTAQAIVQLPQDATEGLRSRVDTKLP